MWLKISKTLLKYPNLCHIIIANNIAKFQYIRRKIIHDLLIESA